MTTMDMLVFVGRLLVTDKKRRPAIFVGLLLVSAVFASVR